MSHYNGVPALRKLGHPLIQIRTVGLQLTAEGGRVGGGCDGPALVNGNLWRHDVKYASALSGRPGALQSRNWSRPVRAGDAPLVKSPLGAYIVSIAGLRSQAPGGWGT